MQGPGSLKEPDMRRGVSVARDQEFPPGSLTAWSLCCAVCLYKWEVIFIGIPRLGL